jgi:hypothetical protein
MTICTSTYPRRLLHAIRPAPAGVLIAAGAMILTAPVGNAIPESTIISECDSAGGTYTTTIVDGKRYSKCCYRDINGVKHCDNYLDGTYTTTDGALEQPPTSPPPPPGEVGSPATAVAPAPPQSGMTLYLPPPVGPAAPPPNQAVLAP